MARRRRRSALRAGCSCCAVLFVAALHPPRRIVAFLLCIAPALAAPFVYDGWDPDAVAIAIASFVIWSALAVGHPHT